MVWKITIAVAAGILLAYGAMWVGNQALELFRETTPLIVVGSWRPPRIRTRKERSFSSAWASAAGFPTTPSGCEIRGSNGSARRSQFHAKPKPPRLYTETASSLDLYFLFGALCRARLHFSRADDR